MVTPEGGGPDLKTSSNAARATILAGNYEVVLTAIEIVGRPHFELPPIVVAPENEVVMAHDSSSGGLAVGVVRGEAVADAVVAVRAAGKTIDQRRTYLATTSNPVGFTLQTGEYTVVGNEIRGAKRSLTVAIAAGADSERQIALASSD